MQKTSISSAAVITVGLCISAGCASSDGGASVDSSTTITGGSSTTAKERPAKDVRADGLAGVSGWAPAPAVCGTASLNAVAVTNSYDTAQSFSITVNAGLSTEVSFSTQDALPVTSSNDPCTRPEIDNGTAYTQDVTVPANGSTTVYLFLGGNDRNLIGDSKSIAIGAGGTQWYDFNLGLNADESFQSLSLDYSGTGGTDPSQNVQTGLFNVMACDPVDSPTASTGLSVTSTIVSTYSSGNTSNYGYGSGQPICLAFVQPGS